VAAEARTTTMVPPEKKKHEKSLVPILAPSVEVKEPPLVKKNKPQKSSMPVHMAGLEEEDSAK
jgi:hypothetical protein